MSTQQEIDRRYWNTKFEQNGLPLLVIIKNHKDNEGRDLVIPKMMKRGPKTIHDWIKAYDNMLSCNQLANKLVTNIIATDSFESFTPETSIEILDMLWLPLEWTKHIVDNPNYEVLLWFDIETEIGIKYYISIGFSQEEDEEDLSKRMEVSKVEFINYLTYLFYYHGHQEEFEITDQDDRRFSFKDLTTQKGTKHMKFYFPIW
jgi:hypothetical protein